MSLGGISQGSAASLLGIEIGRSKVRMALLDGDGKTVDDLVERPIAKAGGPREPMEEEESTRSAIQSGLERLGLNPGVPMLVGVTIGFPHCGVGSGPALQAWLADLSSELREPIVFVGRYGVSYAPVHCINFVRRVFEPIRIPLDRVELAPIAASRVLDSLRSGAITLGSGVAWSARILDRDVLEAFEILDGAFDEVLHVVSNGELQPVTELEGIHVDSELCRNRGVTAGALAPAVGVAVALRDPVTSNLLQGQILTPGAAPQAPAAVPPPRTPANELMEQIATAPVIDVRPPQEPDRWRQEADPAAAPAGRWAGDEPAAPTPPWPAEEPAPPVAPNRWAAPEQPPAAMPRWADDEPVAAPPRWADEQPVAAPSPPPAGLEPPGSGGFVDATQRVRRQAPEGLLRPDSGPRLASGMEMPHPTAMVDEFGPDPATGRVDGFHVSDFLLGALLMLAVVLAAAFFLF